MKQLHRSIGYDTSQIRIIRGLGDIFDLDGDEESIESPHEQPTARLSYEKLSQHDTVWSSQVNGQNRLLSMGDLKFDLGQRVIAVLPVYLNQDKQVEKLSLVAGEIVDVISKVVGDGDIPRLINAKHHKALPDWALPLVISDCKENSNNRRQTIVTAYKLRLDSCHRLAAEDIKKLKTEAQENSRLPYEFDLHFEQSPELIDELRNQQLASGNAGKKHGTRSKADKLREPYDTITVEYRYIMGTESSCRKFIAAKRSNRKVDNQITLTDMQTVISKSKLYSGAYVQYSDKPDAPLLNMVILDYFILEPFDLRFVIRCNQPPKRVLATTKLTSFDVRLAYSADDYYAFHPLERYIYSVIHPPANYPHHLKAVTEIVEDIFRPFEVYVVKKSLCNQSDIESVVCEDHMGNIKIVKTLENADRRMSESFAGSSLSRLTSNPEFKGLKFSGISITTYVKGLSYPEDNPPTEHNSYTFFHSKDYYELDLDPDSNEFLQFVCTSSNHTLFRNPSPKDVILAVPFNCDRDIHKDKVNLRWFYPTEEFRLLHLYIKSNGQDNIFRPPSREVIVSKVKTAARKPIESKKDVATKIKYVRSMFKGSYLSIIDLLLFGLAPNNPTLQSPFTQQFVHHSSLWTF